MNAQLHSHYRILQLIPAAPGWRAADAVPFDAEVDEATATVEELYWFAPVACFALVERWQSTLRTERKPDYEVAREVDQNIEPVIWGEWLEPLQFATRLLGPGEELPESARDEAIQTRAARRRRAAAARPPEEAR